MLGDKTEVIPNASGNRTTPSIVYIKGDELLVGELAKRKAVLEPKNVVYEVKRFIGRQFTELTADDRKVPYEIKASSDGWVLIVIDNKEYKPEQISAFILKKIKEDAEKYLGDKVDRAVITVPAYFNDSQRNATKIAGEIAGLTVERIINEPTAAAFAYGADQTKSQKIVVFDLWGGTFDVTVMDIDTSPEWKTFEVKATSGDTHLGGADFDQRLMKYIIDQFKAKEWIDLSLNPMAMQRIKDEAENAKKQLSQVESVDINIPFITTVEGTPKHIQETITRSGFERLISDLLDRCKTPVQQAVKDSGIQLSEINDIILVGGSTRIPAVIQIIKDAFKKDPKATVNPDESVAVGAAIQWGILSGNSAVSDILLMDVTPLSLSVEVEWWLAHVMIARNTTVPVKKSNIYTTAIDNQPAVTVHITQWERQFAKDNKSLGQFNLEGIPSMRRGQPQIEVTFDIDASGILHVTAVEKSTNKEQKITIQWATGISDEEIANAQADAAKFEEADKHRKETIEAKNKFDQVLYHMETVLADNPDKLPAEEVKIITDLIAEGTTLKNNPVTSKDEFEAETKKYEEELTKLIEKFQATSSAATPHPEDIIEPTTSPTGEVIDAN